MPDFGLVEPFDIDDGSLEGLSPVDSFVLGVEWQMVNGQLEAQEGFERPIHSRNATRIKRACIRRRRRFVCQDEMDGTWMTLTVEPKENADA